MANPNSDSKMEVVEIAKTLKDASTKALSDAKADQLHVDLSIEQRPEFLEELQKHNMKGKREMCNFFSSQIFKDRGEKRFLEDLQEMLKSMKENCDKCIDNQ